MRKRTPVTAYMLLLILSNKLILLSVIMNHPVPYALLQVLGESNLVISNSQLSDSGNYSCTPDNALQDTVTIHVIAGKNSHKSLNCLVSVPPSICDLVCIVLCCGIPIFN